VGTGVDNVLVKLDGPELPILDGSSKPFVDAIDKVGVKQQAAPKVYYTLKQNIYFTDEAGNVEMVAMPSDDFRINTLIDFNSQVLGTQHASLRRMSDFRDRIAPCRTFSFFHELEYLFENDLIKGGDINNAIVVVEKPVTDQQMQRLSQHFGQVEKFSITDEGYLNNLKLRFPNEPARHKLLDLVGDLALVGFPFKAHVIANRPGHASNVAFAKKIKEHIKKIRFQANVPQYDPGKPPLYDIQAIEKILPHRYPFLLVDKIIELDDKHVVGIKNVTFNEPYFQGHFPGNSVMPGVLMVEALAQCGGILAITSVGTEGDKFDTYFIKIDNCKFKQKVVPGDTLILKMELSNPIRRGMCEMHGTVFVGDKVVAEGDLVAQIVKQKND
jgi:UDP-3-O-[3-hydroxymyristoyl] N-acetylglucosamine deacetylase/3-hydroxyacyl-[acyl-carrier-protein] dehydratase